MISCAGILCLTLSGLSPNEQAPVRYVDVTATSGLRFLHRNSATPSKFLIETMTGGVALLDYDNDGWLDVFFVNGAKLKDNQTDADPLDKAAPEFWNRLFRNNHDGTFTDVTHKAGVQGKGYGMGAATGDYDNDGDTDLFVTSYGSSVLYRNNGNGAFSDVTADSKLAAEGWLTSAGFFDYDNDGDLDLFVCRYMQWNFASNIFCGNKGEDGRSYCHPDNFKPVSNLLFRNNGDGTFIDATRSSQIGESTGKSLGLAFADFNNDGCLDVSVANDSYQQFLFKNLGNGVFKEVGVLAGTGYTEDGKTFAGMGTDFADIDDDGFPDIVTTALSNESYAYFHNNGDESFTYATLVSNLGEITRLLAGWGMRIFDYDNDGGKDLFLANSHVMDNIERTQPHLRYLQKPLLLKRSGKKFQDISSASGEVFQQVWASRGAAFGDLDNDGDIDIVVSNCNGPAYFIRNDGGSRNHWIGVELQGKKSNREGIGARVKLTLGSGKVQHSLATTTASYLSAIDRRVFFGLGTEMKVKEIEILWPSGLNQLVANPPIDQFLKIAESKAAAD
ncbi:MAG: CRTAC1 family protein [Acidobacteria bacterium]|nr:CRTAC1 family protein [Acidobacteriota bacterium]